MRVFVLCTGRCGSVTFARACGHIRNFTVGHESRTGLLGPDRLAYPDRHIEVDNRLSWLLGRLGDSYGDDALYVHLTRDHAETAASFAKRAHLGIMRAYGRKGILMDLPEDTDPAAIAADFIETVGANIRLFLRDKTNTMRCSLADYATDFPEFCRRVGADVDMASALAEFETRHNASRP